MGVEKNKNNQVWVDDMIQGIEQWREERPVDQVYDVGIKLQKLKLKNQQINEEILNKLYDDDYKRLEKNERKHITNYL